MEFWAVQTTWRREAWRTRACSSWYSILGIRLSCRCWWRYRDSSAVNDGDPPEADDAFESDWLAVASTFTRGIWFWLLGFWLENDWGFTEVKKRDTVTIGWILRNLRSASLLLPTAAPENSRLAAVLYIFIVTQLAEGSKEETGKRDYHSYYSGWRRSKQLSEFHVAVVYDSTCH